MMLVMGGWMALGEAGEGGDEVKASDEAEERLDEDSKGRAEAEAEAETWTAEADEEAVRGVREEEMYCVTTGVETMR